ncbi:hypothetical protein [Nisaea denitrificans]|uniref:hypothetical protein n=1 Tax=Nisaea denitrificans TaxID=390877 RepID=UPI00040CE0E1|nr:hypothetical protein [Nisaea denitrificans]
MKQILASIALVLSLAACKSEEEAIDGRWVGTITDEARKELRIDGKIADDLFVVVFEPDTIHLNDTVRKAEYLSNKGRTLVKFKNENRVMTIYFDEGDKNKIRMTAVSYFRGKIYNFELERDSD